MALFNMNDQASRVDRSEMVEDCYELEPHSPSGSESSWSTEKSGSTSDSCKLHPHKSSQCRLLAWVAIVRNAHTSITQAQRCTCPMAGCGLQLPSPESMHLHLMTSACLLKSAYYCFEIGKNVRVGKCDSSGCQFLRGRFVSAVRSSMKSMRRHLSERLSKSPPPSQACYEAESNAEEECLMETSREEIVSRLELPSSDQMRPAEMWTASNSMAESRYEMDARPTPFELCSTPAYHHKSDHSQQQSFPSLYLSDTSPTTSLHGGSFEYVAPQASIIGDIHQLFPGYGIKPSQLVCESDNENTSASFISKTSYHHTGLAELCAGGSSWKGRQAHQMNSSWPLSSPCNTHELARSQTVADDSNYSGSSSPMYCGQDTNRHQQGTTSPDHHYEYSEEMAVDDFRTTLNLNEVPGLTYHKLASASRMGSNTSSDSSLAPSTFSSGSETSTSQSSTGSCDMAPANFNQSFLGEESAMFEEPEAMDLSATHNSYEREHNHAVPDNKHFDAAGVSIDDCVAPGCYFSNFKLNSSYMPTQRQITKVLATPDSILARQRSSSPCPDTKCSFPLPSRTPRSTMPSPPEQTSFIPSPQLLMPGKAYCRHCQAICDSSNRSRHEKTCKQNPDNGSMPRIACHYPGCTSTFNRRDNLLQHQRAQKHLAIGSVEVKFSLTPAPGSPMWDLAMQTLGQQHVQSRVEIQEDDSWMDVDGSGS